MVRVHDATLIPRNPAIEAEIAGWLSGARPQPADPAAFASFALRHCMAPLLVAAGVTARLPPRDADRLLAQARATLVLSELRDRELCRILCALREARVDALLMKGAHLAYSHYPAPHLRQRDDADLLIRPEDRRRTARILERDGYARQPDVTSGLVLGQMLFRSAAGAVLDVHWRIVARRVAWGALAFDELQRGAVRLAGLGPCARGLDPVHALALACIHQCAHHPAESLMLWAYDTHLLVSRLSSSERQAFLDLASDRGIVALAVATLDRCVQFFGTPHAASLLESLLPLQRPERSAVLVLPRTPLADLASDLGATRGAWRRAGLVAAHLFPPPAFMRRSSGTTRRWTLPWLYVRRAATGAVRWLKAG